jgi:subtilisin family serine protease
MQPMRRALLATLLCVAALPCMPALASPSLLDREAVRAALRLEPRASGAGDVIPLPLSGGAAPRASVARVPAAVAGTSGPARLLVGVRAHGDLPGVAAALARLGAKPESFAPIGVVAATVPSGSAAARALASDQRVAYVERDAPMRIAADPLDTIDPRIGVKYTWFYDTVGAAAALVAAGGGSRHSIAVLDTGVDLSQPEFATSGRIGARYDTLTKGTGVTDAVGHGTFVTGLIAAVDGNGVGGKGVAGNTKVLEIRASRDGSFTERDLLRGVDFAIRHHAAVLNLSLAGDSINRSVIRALADAFYNDVLPIAASGNKGLVGNPLQFPAAVLGGSRGSPGIGLSVAATRPDNTVADFSTHNRYVSLAAPGAGPSGTCEYGVLSTLPATTGTEWDTPDSCSLIVPDPSGARFAYAEGTSFSAPIASGIAALTWQVEPRLASEQVAEVLTRSANGSGWSEYAGAGILNGAQAVVLARTYDITSPRAKGSAHRSGETVRVRVSRTKDRTEPGRELAGHVSYGLLVSRDGGHGYSVLSSGHHRGFSKAVRLKGHRLNVLAATACDRNGNCGVKRLGRFKP